MATSISNFSFLQGGWPEGWAETSAVAEAAGVASVLLETVILLLSEEALMEEVVEVLPLVNSLSKWGDEAANEGETLDGVFIVDPLDQMLGAHAGPLKKNNIFFYFTKKNYSFFKSNFFYVKPKFFILGIVALIF